MLRNGRAIHVYPRPVAAQGMIVDGVGNHLFSCARLAHNQHRCRMLGHLLGKTHHALEGVTADNGPLVYTRVVDCCGHKVNLFTWCYLVLARFLRSLGW